MLSRGKADITVSFTKILWLDNKTAELEVWKMGIFTLLDQMFYSATKNALLDWIHSACHHPSVTPVSFCHPSPHFGTWNMGGVVFLRLKVHLDLMRYKLIMSIFFIFFQLRKIISYLILSKNHWVKFYTLWSVASQFDHTGSFQPWNVKSLKWQINCWSYTYFYLVTVTA